jgi:hypothetical protein
MVEFMATGEINQSPSEIKNDIITHKLNQISIKFNEKITLLNENKNKFKQPKIFLNLFIYLFFFF